MSEKALIIGSHGTIGRALVACVESKYQVIEVNRANCDYSEADLTRLAQQFAGDSFERVYCCIGVLHNDLVAPEKRFKDLNEQVLNEYFRVNTIIPALCIKYFAPLLDKNRSSTFVCLSAMVGSISDNKLGGWYGYRSSKAALNMMIKSASIELARTHRHSCIAAIHPGTTKGQLSQPFSSNIKQGKYYSPEQSASRIVSVTENLSVDDSGGFFNWDSKQIDW